MEKNGNFDTDAEHIIDFLKVLPSIDAEPVRHGRWIDGNNFGWFTNSCSQCGYRRSTDVKTKGWNGWKYCPMCGCKMDEEVSK